MCTATCSPSTSPRFGVTDKLVSRSAGLAAAAAADTGARVACAEGITTLAAAPTSTNARPARPHLFWLGPPPASHDGAPIFPLTQVAYPKRSRLLAAGTNLTYSPDVPEPGVPGRRAWRTIIEPFRIHAVEPLRMTTPEQGRAPLAAAGLQPVQPASRGRADRPVDRLGDRRHVAATSGRRSSTATSPTPGPLWFTVPGRGHELFPFRHVIPTHQGRARREDPVHCHRRCRPGRPEQHPFRHDAGQRRVHRRRGGRPRRSPRAASPAPATRSRATWTSTPSTGCLGRAAGDVPVVMRDRHEQLRRRPAGQPRQPRQVRRRLRPVRVAAVPRCLPVRGERLVHPGPRGARLRDATSPTSSARWRPSPTA